MILLPHIPQVSNSHFLSIYLVAYFYFLGVVDVLACPAISPSPAMLISAGLLHPPTLGVHLHHLLDCVLPRLAKWLRALPGAGGAATTGKDVPVTLTLGTTVQSWRNSVSSAISP